MKEMEMKLTTNLTEVAEGSIIDLDTVVAHSKDGSTDWIDCENDDMALATVILLAGTFVVENWNEMAKYVPEELRKKIQDGLDNFLESQDLTDDEE